jgi:hypothetical protein
MAAMVAWHRIASFAVGIALLPIAAHAHFVLEAPASATMQNAIGDPQKAPPCGGGTATGAVTPFQAGETITVTINETIYHPGHYRVVLSTTGEAALPADPPVTPDANSPCGSTVVDATPSLPLLADGMLLHTAAFSPATQSFQVKLPDSVTCTKCTLQVVQFMRDHALNNPGGCFYHHCADISISAASGSAGTGGSAGAGGSGGGTVDGGTGADSDSGCGCAASGGRADAAVAIVLLASAIARAYRRARVRTRSVTRRRARPQA